MAEYYPLLSRAVAGLRDAPPEARNAIYERARTALLGQLRSMEPAVPEQDIDHESAALADAIAQVEAEIAAAPAAPDVPVPAPVPAAPPPKQPTAMPARTTDSPPSRPAPPASAVVTAAPAPPTAPPRAAAMPRPSATTMADAPTLRATRHDGDPNATIRPSTSRLKISVKPDGEPGRASQDATTGRVADSPAAAEPSDTGTSFSDTLAGLDRGAPGRAAGREEATRPAAPQPVTREPFSPRLLIVALVAMAVVAGIGYTAWRLRDKPEAIARARAALAAVQQQAAQSSGKVAVRADPGQESSAVSPNHAVTAPAPDTAVATAPAETASPPANSDAASQANAAAPATVVTAPDATPTAPTPAPAEPAALPVSQRAALLVDAPEDAQKVKTYIGSVVWTSESVSPGQGQPLATAVRAEIDVPDANMRVSMLLQKNFEAQFPASHTMELRFMPSGNPGLGSVKQINVPLMRKDDAATGDSFAGLPVTITDNYFLVGLSRGDVMQRNLQLMKERNWFDVTFLFTSGKLAKVTFEKGPTGERLINDAIQSWQQ